MTQKLWSETSKQAPVAYLHRWIVYGNTLVAYIYNSTRYIPGIYETRIQTDAIRFVDALNLEAETSTEKFKLGEMGTFEEHSQPAPLRSITIHGFGSCK